MNNLVNGPEIPMGFGMALAQNISAMNTFANLTNSEQQRIIDRTHAIRSKQEMQLFVDSLTDSDGDF